MFALVALGFLLSVERAEVEWIVRRDVVPAVYEMLGAVTPFVDGDEHPLAAELPHLLVAPLLSDDVLHLTASSP
jgi:hypothetical protein